MILLLSRTAKKLMINRLKRWIDISKVIIISFPNALAPRGFRFFLPLNYTFFTNCPRNFMRIQPESELSIFKTLRFKLYGIKHISKRLKTYNFTWVSLEKILGYLNFNWIAFTIFIYKWCGWLIVRINWKNNKCRLNSRNEVFRRTKVDRRTDVFPNSIITRSQWPLRGHLDFFFYYW